MGKSYREFDRERVWHYILLDTTVPGGASLPPDKTLHMYQQHPCMGIYNVVVQI